MEIIKDKNFDHKKIVINGYDACSQKYLAARNKETEPSLDMITGNLSIGSKVLDLGCGAGAPVTKILSEKYNVTGIDISGKQIKSAKRLVPKAKFICTDMLDFDYSWDYWDAIVSYYAIFHLSKKEQLIVFKKIMHGLKQSGYLLLTLSLINEPGYIEDDFFGTTMFWENYSLSEYCDFLKKEGLEIIYSGVLNHGYNESYDGNEEKHPIIFGKKNK